MVGRLVAQNGGSAPSVATPWLVVALTNLVIGPVAGAAAGVNGVHLSAASTVSVEDSVIANLPAAGIRVDGSGVLKATRTTLRNNGLFVILLTGGSALLADSQLLANVGGGSSAQVSATTTSVSTISDPIISGGAHGVFVRSKASGAVLRLALTRSTIEHTKYAMTSETPGGGTASIAVSGSMIANNGYSWYPDGAGSVIRSLGNNYFTENTRV